MSSQLARLQRLERTLRSGTAAETAEYPGITFARQWVVDHDVDPSIFDAWLEDKRIVPDFDTYTVLMGACFEAWLATGVHIPVYPLHCDDIVAMARRAHLPPHDCVPTCEQICERDARWFAYLDDVHRRGYPTVVLLSDIPGMPPRPVR